MSKNQKIYLLGQEGTGWSIDKDRFYTMKAIQSIDHYELTNNIFKADIIYAIWWNKLLTWKFLIFNFFFKKKVVATITNDLSHQEHLIKKLISHVRIFVYANTNQKNILLNNGISETRLYFNPFYVDETLFKKLDITKESICEELNLDFSKIQNKILIGSFQRDSLGDDLSKPKWQKNPDMLIEIMNKLDKNKFILLLAGPRRHYVINQCKKHGIAYIYIGDESYVNQKLDDLKKNSIDLEHMHYLYNLIDVYLISSQSEGGPKAIPESILCHTHILSTDVGFAKDFLDSEFIYANSQDAVNKINKLISPNITHKVSSKIFDYYTFANYTTRINTILTELQ